MGALVCELDRHPNRPDITDRFGRTVRGDGESEIRRSTRFGEKAIEVNRVLGHRDVEVLRGSCGGTESQQHVRPTLDQDQGSPASIGTPPQNTGHDHGAESAAEGVGALTGLAHAVADPRENLAESWKAIGQSNGMEGFVKTTILTVLVLAGALAVHAQTPVVPSGSVVNGASFASGQAVAPGALVSIFGTNLASTTAQADTIPLSALMANVSVSFNGVPAPMLAVNHLSSYDQINAQLPWNVLPGTAQVVVTNGAASSTPTSLQVVASAPGIFSIAGTGSGQARALNNSDGTFAAPAGSVPGFTTHPAKIGDPNGIAIFATGLGLGDQPVANGGIPTTLTNVLAVPTVLVGNVPAQILFAGMSPQFVGLNQIYVVLAPGTPTGNAVPLQLQVGGIVTTSQLTIAVSQ